MEYHDNKWPNVSKLHYAGAVLALGIISLFGIFCLGFGGVLCGILALVLYSIDNKKIKANPQHFPIDKVRTLRTGKIFAIIGLSISSFFFIILLLMIVSENEAYIMSFPWKFLR